MLQTEVEAALEPNRVCVGDSFQCGNWDQAMVCVGGWVCVCVCVCVHLIRDRFSSTSGEEYRRRI